MAAFPRIQPRPGFAESIQLRPIRTKSDAMGKVLQHLVTTSYSGITV